MYEFQFFSSLYISKVCNLLKWFVAINEPVYIYDANANENYYLLKNDQNTVLALYQASDTTGSVPREQYEYSSYGITNILDQNGLVKTFDHDLNVNTPEVKKVKSDFSNPFGYHGMWRDEHTGLYHTHYRLYDPQHVRWLTPDPAGYRDGQNLYRFYAGPNGVDLLGLDEDEGDEEEEETEDDKLVSKIVAKFAEKYDDSESKAMFAWLLAEGHDIRIVKHLIWDAHDYDEYIGLDRKTATKDIDEIVDELHTKLKQRYKRSLADLTEFLLGPWFEIVNKSNKLNGQKENDALAEKIASIAKARHLASKIQNQAAEDLAFSVAGGPSGKVIKFIGAKGIKAGVLAAEAFEEYRLAKKVAKATAKSGSTLSNRLGIKLHKAYKLDEVVPGVKIKEYPLPSGKKIDFIDLENKIIYELKPHNRRAEKMGLLQLKAYKREVEKIHGKGFTTVLEFYEKD